MHNFIWFFAYYVRNKFRNTFIEKWKNINVLREANEWITAPLSNLSFIAGRCTYMYTVWLLHWLRDVRRAALLATSEIHKGVRHADALSRCETPELDVRRLREWESRNDAMTTCFAARRSFMSLQPPRLAPAV